MDLQTDTNGATPQTGITVVVAADGSEFSDYALQFYAETIHKPGNHVVVAHSTEYKNISFPAVGMISGDTAMNLLQHEMSEEERKTDELVDKLAQRMKQLKIEGSIERIHGNPGPAIIALANDKHASYIVVGCRGKGSVRRTVTGSVTDYVIHHSEVPVIVTRHKDHMHHYGLHLHNPFHRTKSQEDKVPSSP